ncbi:Beta-hexosaminidase [Neolecta irregularis DAH-3]|uniref:Beta-hexosaminidase n=1 Tax=Neolecta irregularis (strain DAH-3) TaxID=1198029 RepID=A0A1U7LG65_NEOID|nr:Beta-hexosaminidase [Neolecta irregularis DAH-3]|eukprot:OLL21637.1 Beta-hexosaminidase [Neolecta irregularis DAH-3]
MLLPLIVTLIAVAVAIWPIPATMSTGNTVVKLSYNPNITFRSLQEVKPETTTKINRAIERFKINLFTKVFVPDMLQPFGDISKFEPSIVEIEKALTINAVRLVQLNSDLHTVKPVLTENENESYDLRIMDNSTEILITGATSSGILHGLTTLSQLFYTHTWGPPYTKIAPVSITDTPRFLHRGINLDLSRNWFSKEDILRTIDAMAFNKMNRLHLHITDAQSWPLEIPAFPELIKAAYSPTKYYSTQDIQSLLSAAEDRGIQILMETDMPGHSTSIAYSHPELITSANIQPWGDYAAEPPSGTLKLNDSNVEDFVSGLFADFLPRLVHHTQYYHTGGDEVNKKAYEITLGTSDGPTLQPFVERFVQHAHKEVFKHDMQAIVWEEMLLDWNISLAKNTTVQVWQSAANVKRVIQKGQLWEAMTFAKSYHSCYPFADYCSPVKSWRLIYSYDPLANLTIEETKSVIGGEIHLWAEQTDSSNLDRMLWPRASAAAEVLWSGRQDSNGVNRTFLEATPRLHEMRFRMISKSIHAEPIQPLWCAQRPSYMCAL